MDKIERYITCNFCKVVYDMEVKPKPLLMQSVGPIGKVAICRGCVAQATHLAQIDLGPNWPRKKEPK